MINFSIVIPLYNKNAYIIRALESIKNQEYKNYEVLIIDDGSTDESINTVREWLINCEKTLYGKIRLISQKNTGVSATRNRGAFEAKYEYIAFLDADDFWKEKHLLNLKNLIMKYHDQVDIFSNGIIFQINHEEIYLRLNVHNSFVGILDYFSAGMESHGYVNSSSVCVKKTALLENPFPLDMKFTEDLVTWARISNSRGVAFSAEKTSVYVHDSAYASVCSDFIDFVKFENYVSQIYDGRSIVKQYIRHILMHAILTARIHMPYKVFVQQTIKICCKYKISTFLTLSALFIPKKLLLFLRNRRKKTKYL